MLPNPLVLMILVTPVGGKAAIVMAMIEAISATHGPILSMLCDLLVMLDRSRCSVVPVLKSQFMPSGAAVGPLDAPACLIFGWGSGCVWWCCVQRT